jgi:tRNA-Thr(GGU) m(6)t(6)A37 methyltransferase TsaA
MLVIRKRMERKGSMITPITYTPVGVIHTPFNNVVDMPVQPSGAQNVRGTIELDPEYEPGLSDLDGFSHIILLYHFHRVVGYKLTVVPFMDNIPHGVFATRAPVRPNALGISIVKLEKIENNILSICDVDMVDGTPLLDIKPFFPNYDIRTGAKSGWLEKRDLNITEIKSDDRFVSNHEFSPDDTK